MTKKLLIKWLEQSRTKALSAANEQFEAALKAYDEALYEEVGLREVADKVQALFTEADQLVMEWHAKHAKLLNNNGTYYGSVHSVCYSFISGKDAAYNKMRSCEFSDNAEPRKAVIRQFDIMRDEVKKNYDNVILNVQRLKDAKLGVEYLTTLGFDLTDLLAQDAAPVETALAVPINSRYLMLGGNASED